MSHTDQGKNQLIRKTILKVLYWCILKIEKRTAADMLASLRDRGLIFLPGVGPEKRSKGFFLPDVAGLVILIAVIAILFFLLGVFAGLK